MKVYCTCFDIPWEDEWPPIFFPSEISPVYLLDHTFLASCILFHLQCTQEHVVVDALDPSLPNRTLNYTLLTIVLTFFSSSQTWGWNSSLGKSLEIFNCFREAPSLTIHITYCTATFFSTPLRFVPWIHRNLDNSFTCTQSSGCLVASRNTYCHLSAKLNVSSKGSVISNHHPAQALMSSSLL